MPLALRWIVVRAAAVEEAIGDDLIDDFALEVGSGRCSEWRDENGEEKYDNVQPL